MKKKFEIKEIGTDFWGRKKYDVTESSDSSNSGGGPIGYLFLFLIVLAILVLPSGIIAIGIYIITYRIYYRGNDEDLSLENKAIHQNKKEILAWISIIISIISNGLFAVFYIYYYEFVTLGVYDYFVLCFLGIVSYFALYQFVNWSTYEPDQKNRYKKKYFSYLVSAIVIPSFLFIYNSYNEYKVKKCLISDKWICTISDNYTFVFKSNGEFEATYDGGSRHGIWKITFLEGNVILTDKGGSNFDEKKKNGKSEQMLDYITCNQFKIGETIYQRRG